MDRAALQAVLGPEMDLESHWQALLQSKPQQEPSLQDLIAYLFETQAISFQQLEAIHQAEPITMSEAEQLQQHLIDHAVQSKLYQVMAPLGQGAMGVVHLAKDRSLLREVALKSLLAPEQGMPPIVIRRFLNEVQITAQLDHPQIIPIYHLSATESGMPAYTMKCIAGKTFKELIAEAREQVQQGQVDEQHQQSRLLDHFLKVCDAMAYAHSRAVIHRDLKPANLMVGPYGDVYVMDWGIAKRIHDAEPESRNHSATAITEADPDATQMGQVLGTLRYMSPQQAAAKNDSLDGRSDLFALGLILFEILSLSPAFTGTSQIDLLKKVLKAELAPLDSPGKSWPITAAMRAIVAKATRQKTEPRYASVDVFAQDIRRCLSDQPVSVYQEPLLQRCLRITRRHARITLVTVLAVATSLMLLTGVSLAIQVKASRATARQEAQLATLLAQGGAKVQAIDSAFLKIQNQLQGLAASAQAQLQAPLQQAPASKATQLYWHQDYSNKPPADSRYSSYYARSVSLQEGVFSAAPGLSQAQGVQEAHQIYPLRQLFRAIFSQNMPADLPANLSTQELEQQWLAQGSAIDRAYLTLASGLHYAFPGQAGTQTQDPRLSPTYQQASKQHGSIWGKPYPSVSEQGLFLPCLQALHDSNGQLLGVAGIELRLTEVLGPFLKLSDLPSVQALFVANQGGQVLLKTEQTDPALPTDQHTQALPAALITRIKQKSNGVYQTQDTLWIYYRINALNWLYILKIDPQQLFKPQG